jgi:hypothetical protein
MAGKSEHTPPVLISEDADWARPALLKLTNGKVVVLSDVTVREAGKLLQRALEDDTLVVGEIHPHLVEHIRADKGGRRQVQPAERRQGAPRGLEASNPDPEAAAQEEQLMEAGLDLIEAVECTTKFMMHMLRGARPQEGEEKAGCDEKLLPKRIEDYRDELERAAELADKKEDAIDRSRRIRRVEWPRR